MMHGFGYGAFGSFGWIGWIVNLVIMLGVIIGFILLVIWAVRRLTSVQGRDFTSVSSAGGQTAREIVQTRYARGEITRDEYKQMLEDLS
jgi:putative membrane protein